MTHVEFPGLGLAFDVNPVAFTIGSFEFRWYGILIALGFILAFLYALKICKRYQVNQDHLIDCIIAGLILGIIGARLYYVIFYPGDMYWKDPIKILYINEGGLGIYGGIIGGLLGGIIMAKIHKMKIPAVLDIAVQGFLIGQGIGRWGNFINRPCPGACTAPRRKAILPASRLLWRRLGFPWTPQCRCIRPFYTNPCGACWEFWSCIGSAKSFRNITGRYFSYI